MKLNDPRYKNQGIHVDIVVFSVSERKIKTLLVKRANKQLIGEWILPGGCVYNNESIDEAAKRELKEKTGLHNIYLDQFQTFGDPDRDPRKRMVSIGYLALVDEKKVAVLQSTPKTLQSMWCDIRNIPKLAFDHNLITKKAISQLRELLSNSNIVCNLLPNTFTLPELQEIYETILGKNLDRRNFRRKMLSLNIIKPTGEKLQGKAHRPANIYMFTSKKIERVNLL